MSKVGTPFGSMAFLICGDLFDDQIISKFSSLCPDWLLFPFARCFSDGSVNQVLWDKEDLPKYIERVKYTGSTALMVNYFAEKSLNDGNTFGGAFVVSASGKVIASQPLGEPGLLVADL